MGEIRKVLIVGGSWHGGNCTGLARGFRALGHAVELVAHDHHIPAVDRTLTARVMHRVLTPMFVRRFNTEIIRAAKQFEADLVVLFKGAFVAAETVIALRQMGPWLANFYPDNTLFHSTLDIAIFRHFDHIFTTKRFGIRDIGTHVGTTNVSFLPHAYDPQVHRPFTDHRVLKSWVCDVSFTGTWSPRKEALLTALRRELMPGQLRIWGGQWERCRSSELRDAIMGHVACGDQFAMAISASNVNLGLLSERRHGASDDDQITSRTFHIPACGGFMLHQRTAEVAEYFEEGTEVGCFSTTAELREKVMYYLSHEEERVRMARAGYERCLAGNSWMDRAEAILDKYDEARGTRYATLV